MEFEFHTVEGAARLLGVDSGRIESLIHQGDLTPFIRVPETFFISGTAPENDMASPVANITFLGGPETDKDSTRQSRWDHSRWASFYRFKASGWLGLSKDSFSRLALGEKVFLFGTYLNFVCEEYGYWMEAVDTRTLHVDGGARLHISNVRICSVEIEALSTEPKLESAIDSRLEGTLLCMIGALANMAGVDLSQPHKAATQVEAWMTKNRIEGPKARTIGERLKDAARTLGERKV